MKNNKKNFKGCEHGLEKISLWFLLMIVMVSISGCGSEKGRKALQVENNAYFTQKIYDNVKEMRFYFGGSEQAEVVNDEEQMYEIFNFLAGLSEGDAGEEEQLWGFNSFEFIMKNGDIHSYMQSGKLVSHWLNRIEETDENYEEVRSKNEEKREEIYLDHEIAEELDALVRGTGE